MSRSPAPYKSPPWREAASAAAYVDERLRAADSGLSAAVQIIKQTSGDPVFAELFDIKLASCVEKARQLPRTLTRSKAAHAKAVAAQKAYKTLIRWAVSSGVVDIADNEALTRIGMIVNDTVVATSPPAVNRRLRATRETGQADADQDERAVKFAIGELAHFVKTMGGGPQTQMMMAVAEALFNPDMVLFSDGVGAKDIEHWRTTYAKIMKVAGPDIHWDDMFGVPPR